MSKITFRADDDLIRQLEEFDASKSEVMRDALRAYLNENGDSSETQAGSSVDDESLDELVAERVDDLIADRLEGSSSTGQPQDVNVNITLDGNSTVSAEGAEVVSAAHPGEESPAPEHESDAPLDDRADANDSNQCAQCGETLAPSHVYCPNCGEKSSRRVFCDCGAELRSDWAFCPGCGRRTPAADVLDNG